MATGDITSSATAYATMVDLEVALEAENTGAATAGADTTTFMIVPIALSNGFWLIKIARSA
jgi:hypothetical protein